MTQIFRQLAERIKRIPPSRGFGIQSPWAYNMMTRVIASPQQYSEYTRLCACHPQQTDSERRLHELLFRLSRHIRAVNFCSTVGDDVALDYVAAGSDAVISTTINRLKNANQDAATIFLSSINSAELVSMAAVASRQSVLIVDGIRADKLSLNKWKALRMSPLSGITFDLYHLALVFFDRDIIKQHYIGPYY